MAIKEQHFQSDLEILRHGGQEAIALFLNTSKRLLETGSDDVLKNWITVAAPALPEAERAEVLTLLMSAYLSGRREMPVVMRLLGAGDPTRTIH